MSPFDARQNTPPPPPPPPPPPIFINSHILPVKWIIASGNALWWITMAWGFIYQERLYTIINSHRLCNGIWKYVCLTHLPLDKMAAIVVDDIFKCVFLNENDRIPIQISLKFVPRSPIDNKPALVQVIAWRRAGDKPLPEPMLAQFSGVYMRHKGKIFSAMFIHHIKYTMKH